MFLESELPYGWHLLSKNESAVMEVELARETCNSHILHKMNANAIAKRIGADDFLFSLEKGDSYLVVVSLTWKSETHPHLPDFKVFDDKKDFLIEYKN